MKIKFWGVRGSIPCPGSSTMKYGGNTPCIELRFSGSDRLIIIDAGTGIRELGNYIMVHDLPNGSINAEIFLTHTHWDHIQGFPFFAPIYLPKTKLKVYGPATYEDEPLENVVCGQLSYRYFPVRNAEIISEIEYIDLKEEHFDLGDGIMLTTKYLNHPLQCLGYCFKYRGKSFCTAYDTEPFRNLFSSDPNGLSKDDIVIQEAEQVAREENRRMEEFFAESDLLVHDAQYTREEYESSKVGWGHSSIEHAIASAKRSKVRRLALFHHEPVRTDAMIDTLTKKYCSADYAGNTEVFFAREGMQIIL